MAKWAKQLWVLKTFDPEEYAKLVYLGKPDIGNKLREDLAFRNANDRNVVFQIKGPTGTGKSTVGCAIALWLLENWHPKGSVFYDNEELVKAARSAGRNVVFVQDEDPRKHGPASLIVDDMLANIESAVARWAQMHFIFINPYETGHLVHFVLDTSPEEIEYKSAGIIKSVVVDIEARVKGEWLDVGRMKVEAPSEEILQEYKAVMVEFKTRMKLTGGVGLKAQILASYDYLWNPDNKDNLITDEDFWKIPLGRDGRLTGKHSYYIARARHVFREDADLIVLFKGADLIAAIGADKFAGYKAPK